jgi:galactokinase/mevalonate kinase-like predicted kinase
MPADPVKAGRILFCYDNPPGTKDISGSQDALGITLPGLNRLAYSGGDYWPVRIETHTDENTLAWLEKHVRLVSLGPRPAGYDVLKDARVTPALAGDMAAASEACWEAILNRDLDSFGKAMSRSFAAQVAMLPNALNDRVSAEMEKVRGRVAGCKLAGAGGGGYLIVVTDEVLEGSKGIAVARK